MSGLIGERVVVLYPEAGEEGLHTEVGAFIVGISETGASVRGFADHGNGLSAPGAIDFAQGQDVDIVEYGAKSPILDKVRENASDASTSVLLKPGQEEFFLAALTAARRERAEANINATPEIAEASEEVVNTPTWFTDLYHADVMTKAFADAQEHKVALAPGYLARKVAESVFEQVTSDATEEIESLKAQISILEAVLTDEQRAQIAQQQAE